MEEMDGRGVQPGAGGRRVGKEVVEEACLLRGYCELLGEFTAYCGRRVGTDVVEEACDAYVLLRRIAAYRGLFKIRQILQII